MYLIRPMTFTLNILKSICLDNTHLPMYKDIFFVSTVEMNCIEYFSWKIYAQLSSIDCRLSNTHLFEVFKLIQSIPSSQLDQPLINTEITIDEVRLNILYCFSLY